MLPLSGGWKVRPEEAEEEEFASNKSTGEFSHRSGSIIYGILSSFKDEPKRGN